MTNIGYDARLDRGREHLIAIQVVRTMHATRRAVYVVFEGRAVASAQENWHQGSPVLSVSVNRFCPPAMYRALARMFCLQPVVCDYV